MKGRAIIHRLPTGVRGLDSVLGGGLPEFSFNLVAGGPGCGKTTLMHQLVFANGTPERPAMYFTILGEPPLKMLRYQQQFGFFDADKVGSSVRFIHLGQALMEGGLRQVLESLTKEVARANPGIVVVDSFRSAADESARLTDPGALTLQHFVQILAIQLTSSQATTFLVGEYEEAEVHSNSLFTVADGIVWLRQTVVRNSVVRRIQVLKLRGQKEVPGLHTMRITDGGVEVFPRLPSHGEPLPARRPDVAEQKATGVAGLDEMLGGGIPAGHSMLITGPSGSGKTLLTSRFLVEGLRHDEPCVLALFEKGPEDFLRTSPHRAVFEKAIREDKMELIYLRPVDLSVDETLEELSDAVSRVKARRVVVDSLSGLQLALAPPFREDFREAMYRLVAGLTGLGVTVVLTIEVLDSPSDRCISPPGLSFLTDGVILQRYLEEDGEVRRVLTVLKLRGHSHSKAIRYYDIGADGLRVGAGVSAEGRPTGSQAPGGVLSRRPPVGNTDV